MSEFGPGRLPDPALDDFTRRGRTLQPRRTHASNKVYVLEGGNEDNDLWVTVDFEAGIVHSVWEPTDEQRQRIAEGANIQLSVWGGQPPVTVSVNDEWPLGKKPESQN